MKRIVTYLALVFGFAGFLAAGLMAARRPSTTTVAKEPERLWEQYTVRSN